MLNIACSKMISNVRKVQKARSHYDSKKTFRTRSQALQCWSSWWYLQLLCFFSVEYINSLNPNGMPHHCLTLKPGVPLMLLRNLEPKRGLCNGSRLIFHTMSTNNWLMICSYSFNGEEHEVAIPRIILKPKDKEFPFDWSPRQFPV